MERIRQAQEKFSILDQVPLGACILQSDLKILFWNNCLEEWTKLPRTEMLGTGIGDRYPHFHQPQYANRLQQIFQGGPPTIFSSQLHKHLIPAPLPQGRMRIQHTTVTPLPALDDGEFYALLSIQDVTDLTFRVQEYRHMRDRALVAQETAEKANRIKDEFLAIVSHELRSPLNPILGWSRLLRTSQLNPATIDRALDTIERNAKLQAQLIEDLLDVSRILRGKLTLNWEIVDLANTITSALDTVVLAAEAKSIQIELKLNPNIGRVRGDSNRLQQVVWNLLSNAIKFTPSGGRVEISLARVEAGQEDKGTRGQGDKEDREAEGQRGRGASHVRGFPPLSGLAWAEEQRRIHPRTTHHSPRTTPLPTTNNQQPTTNYAQIQISDTGKGISVEFLPYIFEYFRQADSSITRAHGGLGLGLAIARQLVELHGGTIWAESQGDSMGATFTVQIPVCEQSKENKAEGAEEAFNSNFLPLPTPDSRLPTPLLGLQILVVDDDADTRELLAFMLEQRGARVAVASSAMEAIAAVLKSRPDVILSDLGMPDIDGYALIRQLRTMSLETGEQIPAIALTSYAAETTRKQVLAAGYQKYISKPVEPTELVTAIVELVRAETQMKD